MIVDGRLRQLATAAELVRHPRDAFVAGFTGAHVLLGDARPLAGGGAEVRLDAGPTVRSRASRGEGRVAVAVYPWEVSVVPGTRRGRTDATRSAVRSSGSTPTATACACASAS